MDNEMEATQIKEPIRKKVNGFYLPFCPECGEALESTVLSGTVSVGYGFVEMDAYLLGCKCGYTYPD